ncbi:MAG: hypothetical protein Q9219_000743 [cf. Caloplaca sp. 3 TL-2023]
MAEPPVSVTVEEHVVLVRYKNLVYRYHTRGSSAGTSQNPPIFGTLSLAEKYGEGFRDSAERIGKLLDRHISDACVVFSRGSRTGYFEQAAAREWHLQTLMLAREISILKEEILIFQTWYDELKYRIRSTVGKYTRCRRILD